MNDPYDLQRFVNAQNEQYGRAGHTIFDEACEELRAGAKRSHWMWFVFPQIKGLGSSPFARKFAISSVAEAQAYLLHPVLGPRLIDCTQLMNQIQGRTAGQILGGIDEMKFRSSMTLFSAATTENRVFLDALEKYFQGEPDQATLERI
jgi:uncharacterized protein (DUF1810 family)